MLNKIYEKIKKFILENYKFMIILIVLVFTFTYEFPYVVYTPGGIVNLEKRIDVEKKVEKKGSLNMSYVTLRKGNIPSILLSFVIPDWDLLKESEVTIDDESVDDLLKMEKLYMTSSIDNATILAYKKANKEIKITNNVNNVIYIDDLAKTDVQVYDQIISVDGNNISDINDLKKYISTKNENDIVYFKVKTKASESGSSGGLMLSLAIYNSLIDEDITKGKKVVGTGTIDINGNVGKIDGVKYKILGAVKNKADLFICPKENYDEAIRVKKNHNLDIKIISVETFDEAIEYLNNN